MPEQRRSCTEHHGLISQFRSSGVCTTPIWDKFQWLRKTLVNWSAWTRLFNFSLRIVVLSPPCSARTDLFSFSQLEVIGGADKYLAVCRSCYKKSPLKVNPSPRAERARQSASDTNKATRKLFGTEIDQNVMEVNSWYERHENKFLTSLLLFCVHWLLQCFWKFFNWCHIQIIQMSDSVLM